MGMLRRTGWAACQQHSRPYSARTSVQGGLQKIMEVEGASMLAHLCVHGTAKWLWEPRVGLRQQAALVFQL